MLLFSSKKTNKKNVMVSRGFKDINVIQPTEIFPYLELYSLWSIFTFIVHSA